MTFPFNWIFFDCFNTLIDDFDEEGDESGLGPMQHLPIQAGLYDNVYEFRADYLDWRRLKLMSQSREMNIDERLTSLLKRRSPETSETVINTLVNDMVACFKTHYLNTLRLPAGVQEMLEIWYGQVSMGVVSNFHISQLPESLLHHFGLRPYLEFVVDSAQCGHRKPGDEIYAIAAAQGNLSPSEYSKILFIGDHLLNDCLTPLKKGMKSIYFDRSKDRANSTSPPPGIPSIQSWSEFRPETIATLLGSE